jgi:hypothetical protein
MHHLQYAAFAPYSVWNAQLVARRSLADAADVAAVLHGRVDRWYPWLMGQHQTA